MTKKMNHKGLGGGGYPYLSGLTIKKQNLCASYLRNSTSRLLSACYLSRQLLLKDHD